MAFPARLSIAIETIERRIYLIRGHKVLLSTHLAELYDVEETQSRPLPRGLHVPTKPR